MAVSFSIIIPTYNRAGLIIATIQSFLDQEYSPLEIIVVDDGGSDNTEEVVRSLNDSRINYYKKNNEERGMARNYGGALAKGDYLTFFDSDDIVYPWYLSHAKANLEKLKYPECYAQHFEFRNEPPNTAALKKASNDIIRDISNEIVEHNFLACNGVFIRKDIFEQFKFSPERALSGSEDWFLWLQLAANFHFYYSPVSCSCLIMHDQRGEANIVSSKLIPRLNLLMRKIETDPNLKKFPETVFKRLHGYTYLFAAVKLADFNKYKMQSIIYLAKATLLDPRVFFRRTYWVAKRKLAFKWTRNS